jgi:hypothetical protein
MLSATDRFVGLKVSPQNVSTIFFLSFIKLSQVESQEYTTAFTTTTKLITLMLGQSTKSQSVKQYGAKKLEKTIATFVLFKGAT